MVSGSGLEAMSDQMCVRERLTRGQNLGRGYNTIAHCCHYYNYHNHHNTAVSAPASTAEFSCALATFAMPCTIASSPSDFHLVNRSEKH